MPTMNGWRRLPPASPESWLPLIIDVRDRIARLEGRTEAYTSQVIERLAAIEARLPVWHKEPIREMAAPTAPSTAQASTIFSRLGVSPLEAAALTLAVALGLSGVLAPGDMRAILLALLGAKP